uniref:Uncharacterized protein n=1 Tax=Arundo donax TaxID=35708 RepID=A0A0A9CI95_ARUDO
MFNVIHGNSSFLPNVGKYVQYSPSSYSQCALYCSCPSSPPTFSGSPSSAMLISSEW